MAEMRHPHVVQFLGLCYLEGSTLPVLVMEQLALDTSLDDLLKTSPGLPLASSYHCWQMLQGVSSTSTPATLLLFTVICQLGIYTPYIITGGQDQWPWKCSYCWPSTWPAGQDPLPCTRNISLYATWIFWWAFTIWSSAGHLLVWSPCTFHPHTGQKDWG